MHWRSRRRSSPWPRSCGDGGCHAERPPPLHRHPRPDRFCRPPALHTHAVQDGPPHRHPHHIDRHVRVFDPALDGLQSRRSGISIRRLFPMDPAVRHHLPRWRRRRLTAAGAPHHPPPAGGGPRRVVPQHRAHQIAPHHLSLADHRDDRHLRRPRSLPVLCLLGDHPDSDVLHHRRLGRTPPHLRCRQVLHLHHGGIGLHAGGDPLPRLVPSPADRRLVIQLSRLPPDRSACCRPPAACLLPASSFSPRLRSPLPSRSRSFRFTPGFPTPTSRLRAPDR